MAMPRANMVVCPNCGFENIEGSDACENCQSDLRTIDIPITMQHANESDLTLPLTTARLSRPIIISVRATVRDAIDQMMATGSGALVVVEGDAIVGMFTERDVLKKLAGIEGALDQNVADFMTPDPVVLRETDSMAVALNKMGIGGFRHIPLTRDGELVAMVSVRDVLKWVVGRYLD